jgi:hypothetical protein
MAFIQPSNSFYQVSGLHGVHPAEQQLLVGGGSCGKRLGFCHFAGLGSTAPRDERQRGMRQRELRIFQHGGARGGDGVVEIRVRVVVDGLFHELPRFFRLRGNREGAEQALPAGVDLGRRGIGRPARNRGLRARTNRHTGNKQDTAAAKQQTIHWIAPDEI